MKRKVGRPRKPRPEPEPTLGDPHADLLATLRNGKLKHSRRYAEARWCLKNGLHATVALATLREIIAKPDRSMLKRNYLDMARRTLIRYDSSGAERPLYMPKSWRREVGEDSVRAAWGNRAIVWTDDMSLVEKCWAEHK